jgi:catechol 2,3-dioxygenase-like lactoylglutathione lyase family enzyme
MTIQFSQPTSILRMFHVEKTLEFYVDYLGFEVKWEHRFAENLPLYLEIVRGDCVIHLSEHHGDCTPISALRIPVSDAALLHTELSAKEYRYMTPGFDPVEKEVCLSDPAGNRLIFFQPHTPSR